MGILDDSSTLNIPYFIIKKPISDFPSRFQKVNEDDEAGNYCGDKDVADNVSMQMELYKSYFHFCFIHFKLHKSKVMQLKSNSASN